MIEGGIFGIVLFLSIFFLILLKLQDYKYILWATLGILLMNLVLHSFESVHTAIAWSTIIATIITVPQIPLHKKYL
jgi:uracil DNA glycosylase